MSMHPIKFALSNIVLYTPQFHKKCSKSGDILFETAINTPNQKLSIIDLIFYRFEHLHKLPNTLKCILYKPNHEQVCIPDCQYNLYTHVHNVLNRSNAGA